MAGAAVRPAIGADDLPGPAGAGGQAAASMASRARLASGPPRYSPVVPSLRTTRWQGTTSGSGLCEQALAAARSAQDPGADVAGQARQYGVVVLAAEGHAHQPLAGRS